MGTARFVFNKTVEYLRQTGTKANWKLIKTGILNDLPKWAKDVPYQIKSIAIRDACLAVRQAKLKFKQTGQIQQVKFRSKKAQRDSIYIPKSAVQQQTVYRTLLGENLNPRELFPQIKYDCRLVYQQGEYYLCIPFDKAIKQAENQRQKLVALDPGVRTFMSFYSETLAGKLGEHDFGRIVRLCYYLDDLMSRMSQVKCRQRYQMWKAAGRIRQKIKNLVNELHYQTAVFFCKQFETILLPTFETQQMVSKLHSKTARSMLTWAHYRFKTVLKDVAEVYQSKVIDVNEAYTSKTCTVCGYVQSIGGRETWTCKSCGTDHDRDLNASRGIYLKYCVALGDTPSRQL